MSTINQNDVIECEVCRNESPVFIPLIPCAHSNSFCETCIKQLLAVGRPTCPKCRAKLPLINDLPKTNQSHFNIANDVSLAQEYYSIAIRRNTHFPPSSTADCAIQSIIMYFSIGLLLGLIIYPAVK